jgi:leader peptidase (prepilin peptidase)/N-methyltransferase
VLIIDLEHWLVLNVVIVPAIGFAVIASPFSAIGVASSIAGGATALVIASAMYVLAQVHARVRQVNIVGGVFGQGDIKLALYIGLIVGFPAAMFAMALTIGLGGITAVIYLAYQLVVRRRFGLGDVIPYAPHFCIAGWLTILFLIPGNG